MKKAKIKAKKNEKEVKEQGTGLMDGKSIVIMIVVMALVFVTFYFLTNFLISRNEKPASSSTNSNSEEKDSNEIAFSQLLKQSDKTYYVFAILENDKTTVYTEYADRIGTKYYQINMKDAMNKAYIGEETLIGETAKDIKISDSTLFVIVDGKVDSYYAGKDNIINYLKEKVVEKK